MSSVQELESMDPASRYQLVGNSIFPHIASLVGDQLAGKVTGMCLELPLVELVMLLNKPETIKAAVDQALAVLPPEMRGPKPSAEGSPTSVVDGPSSDRWADEMDGEADELPPVCDLFAAAAERRQSSNSKAEAEAEAGPTWQVAWDVAFWTVAPADEVVSFVSDRLEEPQVRIVRAVVEMLGIPVALELLARTEHIQAEGGMMVPETGKPRTSGGIYLKLLKDATNLPREAQDAAVLRIKNEGKRVKPAQKGRVSNPNSPHSPARAQLGEFVVADRRSRR